MWLRIVEDIDRLRDDNRVTRNVRDGVKLLIIKLYSKLHRIIDNGDAKIVAGDAKIKTINKVLCHFNLGFQKVMNKIM